MSAERRMPGETNLQFPMPRVLSRKGSWGAAALLLGAALLFGALTSVAWAMSDDDYRELRLSSPEFDEAEKRLAAVWNEVKASLPPSEFAAALEAQRNWIRANRDIAANQAINDGKSRTEAYIQATLARVNYLEFLVEAAGQAQSPASKCVSGDCQNGQGAILYSPDVLYMGGFSNGKRQGWGAMLYKDGRLSMGEFKDDALNGKGAILGKDKLMILGDMQNNAFSGRGIYVSEFTYFFPEEYKMDKGESCPAIEIRQPGMTYEGIMLLQYKDGEQAEAHDYRKNLEKNGKQCSSRAQSNLISENVAKYMDNSSECMCLFGDCDNGTGEAQYKGGYFSYFGKFTNGKRDGDGIYRIPAEHFVGHFSDDKMSGQFVHYYDHTGNVSLEERKDDSIVGPAILAFNSGDYGSVYVGGCKDGEYDGYGVRIATKFSDGDKTDFPFDIRMGRWANNELVEEMPDSSMEELLNR